MYAVSIYGVTEDEMKSLGMKYKAIRDGYQIKIEYTKVDPNFFCYYIVRRHSDITPEKILETKALKNEGELKK